MDQLLRPLWLANSPPFAGNCLYLDDLVPITSLRRFLQVTFQQLQPAIRDGQLFKFADWHEHDGHLSSRERVSVSSVEAALASDNSFYASRHGDTFVHWAFYPEDTLFLLRYYILDEGEDEQYPGIWGTCDLTADNHTLAQVHILADERIVSVLRVGKAKDYFDQNFAG